MGKMTRVVIDVDDDEAVYRGGAGKLDESPLLRRSS
jgi:hypothetical protein